MLKEQCRIAFSASKSIPMPSTCRFAAWLEIITAFIVGAST